MCSFDRTELGVLVKTFSLTHTGLKRKTNEDRYLVKELDDSILLAVADGMGGEVAGDYAAEIAIKRLSSMRRDGTAGDLRLSELVKGADQALQDEIKDKPDLEGMGTTITATLLEDSIAHWVHVGDSRLYIFRGEQLIQITKDQNLAQFLVDEGEITAEEARKHPLRHLLDQCVGCGECKPEIGHFEVKGGDLIILSTDGLHGTVSGETIASFMTGEKDIETKVRSLLKATLDTGGKDNITVVVAEILLPL